jgi:hypothetical protein
VTHTIVPNTIAASRKVMSVSMARDVQVEATRITVWKKERTRAAQEIGSAGSELSKRRLMAPAGERAQLLGQQAVLASAGLRFGSLPPPPSAAAPSPMATVTAPSPMTTIAVAAPSPMAAAATPPPMAPLDRRDMISRGCKIADHCAADWRG